VDFVTWLLFSREKLNTRPKHLLCNGLRKSVASAIVEKGGNNNSSHIPGLYEVQPNDNARALKAEPWPQLLALLGKSGEAIMLDLLVDSAIFVPVESGIGNYHQLCGESARCNIPKRTSNDYSKGIPISELEPGELWQSKTKLHPYPLPSGLIKVGKEYSRQPAEIAFIRNRMMYARPALNSSGSVLPGFRHIRKFGKPSQRCICKCANALSVKMFSIDADIHHYQ
jgi:telomerase reverse transcriptase